MHATRATAGAAGVVLVRWCAGVLVCWCCVKRDTCLRGTCHEQTADGQTALHCAAAADEARVCQALLHAGWSPRPPRPTKRTCWQRLPEVDMPTASRETQCRALCSTLYLHLHVQFLSVMARASFATRRVPLSSSHAVGGMWHVFARQGRTGRARTKTAVLLLT